MATLFVPDALALSSVTSMRGLPRLGEWLAGDWAMLFSDPDDFLAGDAACGRDSAGLAAEFRRLGVRPLQVSSRRDARVPRWLAEAAGDDTVVVLGDSIHGRGGAFIDFTARLLRDDLEDIEGRYVVVVDSQLFRRATFRYRSAATAPAPLDLLSAVGFLSNPACAAARGRPADAQASGGSMPRGCAAAAR